MDLLVIRPLLWQGTIGMALATEEFGLPSFLTVLHQAVFRAPWYLKDPSKVRESWNQLFQGSGKANRVAVLEEGMTYKQIGMPPNEAQVLRNKKSIRRKKSAASTVYRLTLSQISIKQPF